MKPYDYLIVGGGLFGAVFCHQATLRNKRCLVIDKRNHLGGNIYCETIAGITVHKYGPHIFHTSDAEVWEYVNKLASFNRFTNAPIACCEGKLYNLPFNMNTFYRLWNVKTPAEARRKIAEQTKEYQDIAPRNLEEQALKLVGKDIYFKLIKGYTEKQWGRDARDIPAFIIRRIPLRFTFDNNYFNDTYQGVPVGGYNILIDRLLDGADIQLNKDYLAEKERFSYVAEKTVYTGMIDEFFGYRFGKLAYRSLRFESELLDMADFQGNAVVNYTDKTVPYTRIIEHKHFEFGAQPQTLITKEFSEEWDSPSKEAYYPVNDEKNNQLFSAYKMEANKLSDVIFGGRLADYAYYDMDKVIRKALDCAKEHLL